jgi:hypothetical protein
MLGNRFVHSAVILLLLFGVLYLASDVQDVIFSIASEGGQQCPAGSWGPPCKCMPGFRGELDGSSSGGLAKGNCTCMLSHMRTLIFGYVRTTAQPTIFS